MKYLLPLALVMVFIAGCKTSKNYLARLDDDKTLFDAVKALDKNAGDTNALKALPLLYSSAEERHLQKISQYSNSADISRWDKLLNEYGILQSMYNSISSNATAAGIVLAKNYQSTIADLEQQAAEDFYQEGIFYSGKIGRDNIKQSYAYFKKIGQAGAGF